MRSLCAPIYSQITKFTGNLSPKLRYYKRCQSRNLNYLQSVRKNMADTRNSEAEATLATLTVDLEMMYAYTAPKI
jgi:hypothetical protein